MGLTIATDWKAVIQDKIAHVTDRRSVTIQNKEFDDLDSRQAGYIIWNIKEQDYTVGNADTQAVRFQLTEDQVEPTMAELDIANSEWE